MPPTPALTGGGGGNLGSLIIAIQVNIKELNIGLKEAEKKTKESAAKMEKSMNRSSQGFSVLFRTISRLASLAGMAIAALVGQLAVLAKTAFRTAADYEKTERAFSSMVGSARIARTTLQQIENLKSPFKIEGLQENARLLLAYGIEAKKLVPTLKVLGDINAGTGGDFGRLALAYGQVRTKTRLYAQEIRQLTENGVPILRILARQLGVTETAADEMAKAGEISFEVFEQALFSMARSGGIFENMMENLANTSRGLTVRIRNAWWKMTRDLGEAFLPVSEVILKDVVGALEKLRDIIKELKPQLDSLATFLAGVASAVAEDWKTAWDFLERIALLAIEKIKMEIKKLPGAMAEATRDMATELLKSKKISPFEAITFGGGLGGIIRRLFPGTAKAGETGRQKEEAFDRKVFDLLLDLKNSSLRGQQRQKEIAAQEKLEAKQRRALEQLTDSFNEFNKVMDNVAKRIGIIQPGDFRRMPRNRAMEMMQAGLDAVRNRFVSTISGITSLPAREAGLKAFQDQRKKDLRNQERSGFVGFAALGRQIQESILREEERKLLEGINNSGERQVALLQRVLLAAEQKLVLVLGGGED